MVLRSILKTLRLSAKQNPHWIFFVALSLFYISLTPGTIEGMGYTRENLAASNQIVSYGISLIKQTTATSITWPRHGLIEPLLELPFAVVSRLLFGDSVKWLGRFLILQPIIATALISSICFAWVKRITSSLKYSYVLSLALAFSTMLWPYAYIGMETTQSLSLFYLAYLCLEKRPTYSWKEILVFAGTCAITLSVKQNSIFLLPAVFYLSVQYFYYRCQTGTFPLGNLWPRLVFSLLFVLAVFALNMQARKQYWSAMPAADFSYAQSLLNNSLLVSALNAFSYFGSPNKSLLIFAPVSALGLASLWPAFQLRRDVAAFALLVLVGLAGGFSLTIMWAEESWGPRYLHPVIAPLIIVFAIIKTSAQFAWRKEVLLLSLAAIGFVVSFLGTFFYYGKLHEVSIKTSNSTLEKLQHDPRMNHILFNAELLKRWVYPGTDTSAAEAVWPPSEHWWFEKPPTAQAEQKISLQPYAIPQPLLLNTKINHDLLPGKSLVIVRYVCLTSLLSSFALLIWLYKICWSTSEPSSK